MRAIIAMTMAGILGAGICSAGTWCLLFDGIDDWVEIYDSPLDNTDPAKGFTCEGWASIHQVEGSPDSDVIFYNGPHAEFSVTAKDAHQIGFALKFSDIDWQEILAPIDWSRWFHFAAVYDRPMDQMPLYVDGQLQSWLDLPSDQLHAFHSCGMGTYTPDLMTNGYFHGWIDSIHISERARYNSEFPPPLEFEPDQDSMALWDLEEGDGGCVNEDSPHNHLGDRHGSQWVRTAGVSTAASSWSELKSIY